MKSKTLTIFIITFIPLISLAQKNWLHLSWQVEKNKNPWLEAKILPTNYSILNLSFDWKIHDGSEILTPANSPIYLSIEPKFLEYSLPSNQTHHRIKLILPFNISEFKIKATIPLSTGQYEKTWQFKFEKPKVIVLPQTEPPTYLKNYSGSFMAWPVNFMSDNLSFQWEKNGEILSTNNQFQGDLKGVKLKVLNRDFPLESYEKIF